MARTASTLKSRNVTMGEIKRYNNGVSLLGEARVKLAYWAFIWTRRYHKYVLKR